MTTATIYTLNAKVVPVESYDTTVRMWSRSTEITTLYVEGEQPLITPKSELIELPLHRVGSFQRITPPTRLSLLEQPIGAGHQTPYHLFAVEPELRKILSAPFREEWVLKLQELETKVSDLTDKLAEAEKNMKIAESTVSHLKELEVDLEGFKLRDHRRRFLFSQAPLWKRLWIALRNPYELT